jgi:hypothetical protein
LSAQPRLEHVAIAGQQCYDAPKFALVVCKDAGFAPAPAAFGAHLVNALPEADEPPRRRERLLCLGREVREKGVDERHVPKTVDTDRVSLVLHLAHVAGGAVQSDHVDAGRFRFAERDADRQAIRIAGALRIGQQSIAFDVFEKWPHLQRPVRRRALHFQCE